MLYVCVLSCVNMVGIGDLRMREKRGSIRKRAGGEIRGMERMTGEFEVRF